MSKDTQEQFHFSFQVEDPARKESTRLELYNGYNELVAEGNGVISKFIPKGLYQLKLEMNQVVEHRDYRVTEDIDEKISSIQTASAIPSMGFSTTHEYFSGPSFDWSTRSTTDEQPIQNSSIFLFLRYSNVHAPFEDVMQMVYDFSILNASREVVFRLNKGNTRTSSGEDPNSQEYYGTAAFHMSVDPGQYYIIYDSRVELPLYVFSQWQTQLFMMVDSAPIFSSACISIEKHHFNMNSIQNVQLDALIQKLYNGLYFLPEDLRYAAAHGKWENPMLGIIACHMLAHIKNEKDIALFDTILNNLQQRILHNESAPDLIALQLLGAEKFGRPIPDQPLTAPCMIATGLQAFQRQALTREALIPRNGPVEQILTRMLGHSIWTTYQPLAVKDSRSADVPNPFITLHGGSSGKSVSIRMPIGFSIGDNASIPEPDWITHSIFNQVLDSKVPIDISTLASELQLTTHTVKSALQSINNNGFRMINSLRSDLEEVAPDLSSTIDSLSQKINAMLKE